MTVGQARIRRAQIPLTYIQDNTFGLKIALALPMVRKSGATYPNHG